MKAIHLIPVFLLQVFALHAQTTDSMDNIILKIPRGWQVTKQNTYTGLTFRNAQQNSFCQVAIYQQQPASGSHSASFQKEWDELMLAYFETSVTPSPQLRRIKNATDLFYGAQVVNKANRLSYYSELHVIDCGGTVQSILVTSGSKKHLAAFDSVWKSLISAVRKSSGSPANTGNINTPPATTGHPFNGRWGKSASSAWGTDPGSVLTYAGYTKCQYDFKPGGTYTMRGESMAGHTEKWTLLDESGTFQVEGQQLIITPAKSTLRQVNREGKVLSTKALDASMRTYTWQTHYFEGLNEMQLVLRPAKDYFQDGGFSSSETFPNSYLYSQPSVFEWRFN